MNPVGCTTAWGGSSPCTRRRRGRRNSYRYDFLDRLTDTINPDGVLLFSAEYDLAGNLTAETDAAGRTVCRKYISNMSYEDIKKNLYERYEDFMKKKEKRGRFKDQGSSLADDELKSLLWKDEYGIPYEKHHMPSANNLPTSIPYKEGACANVPTKIHDQTFTNGLSQSNRPYDYALYNSLTYEDQLAFDNQNLKDLYGRMKPGADQEEIARRIDANYEFSMQNKENHPEKVESEGTCPDK